MGKTAKRIISFICIAMLGVCMVLLDFPKEVCAAERFILTLSSDDTGVEISWDSKDDRLYRTYKSDDGTSFSPLGMDYNLADDINVLQIYPVEEADGQLKEWLETNGYGKGVVHVDSVCIDDYNETPELYMVGSDGGWKYDVIFFGTWDYNAGKDLSEKSRDLTKRYIKDGRGCIFGHDTLDRGGHPGYFLSLASYAGVRSNVDPTTHTNTPNLSDKVRIKKAGLFTSYPWYIGEVGDVLAIPFAHSGQIADGDIWLEFVDPIDPSSNAGSNFYLTTNNNCAMIQTGHSNGEATEDEQKILANLVFYCTQFTSDAHAHDAMAADFASPIKPQIEFEFEDNETIRFSVCAEDEGTPYYYYVEEFLKNDTTENGVVRRSNVESEIVVSGISKYIYIVDEYEDTVVDEKQDRCRSSYEGEIEIDRSDKKQFVHIAAVDNNGNVGETNTVIVNGNDKTPPSVLEVDANFKVKAEDTTNPNYEYVSGIKGYAVTSDISKPTEFYDSVQISGGSGRYYIWASDNAGNISDPYEVRINSRFHYGNMEISSLEYNGKTVNAVFYNGKRIFF